MNTNSPATRDTAGHAAARNPWTYERALREEIRTLIDTKGSKSLSHQVLEPQTRADHNCGPALLDTDKDQDRRPKTAVNTASKACIRSLCCLHRRTHTQSCPRLYPAEHQLRRAFVSHIHIEQGTHWIVPDPKELHQAVSIDHRFGQRKDSVPDETPPRVSRTWTPVRSPGIIIAAKWVQDHLAPGQIVLGESGPDQRASQAPSAHDSQAHQPVRYLRLRSPIVTPPHYLLGTRPQVHQMQIKPRPAPRRSGPGRSSACRCPPRC